MELRRTYLRAHGLDKVTEWVGRSDENRVQQIESALLMCGRHVAFTKNSPLWRVLWMLRGAAFRVIVSCRLRDPAKWVPGLTRVAPAALR